MRSRIFTLKKLRFFFQSKNVWFYLYRRMVTPTQQIVEEITAVRAPSIVIMVSN